VKLLEVQEVLAEREFRVGRFYFMKESWPAAIARLRSLTDTYPLFSQADEALYMQGSAYETEVNALRNLPSDKDTDAVKAAKNKMIREYEDKAAEAYSKIVTRYPLMPRAGDAKSRLAAIDRPVPKPTEDAIALNKKEQESRGAIGRMGRIMGNFKKKPEGSVVAATKVGQPTLTDPKQTDATTIVRDAADAFTKTVVDETNKKNNVSVETVAPGSKVPESQAAPRSSDPDQAAPAPEQVNEAATPMNSTGVVNGKVEAAPATSGTAATAGTEGAATSGTTTTPAASTPKTDEKTDKKKDDKSSSSKDKKKKGIRRVLPF